MKHIVSSAYMDELLGLISELRHLLIDEYRTESRKLHYSVSQLEVLHYVGQQKKATMKSVAHYLRITPPSATAVVDLLVTSGMIRRKNSTKDRRTIILELTPKAIRFSKAIQKKKLQLATRLIQKLNPEQQKHLADIITTLVH